MLTAARALDVTTRPDLHVAWGIGGSFEQSVLSIPLLEPSPRYVRYFGDLDLAGLQIAARSARQAAEADLRPVLPAIALAGPTVSFVAGDAQSSLSVGRFGVRVRAIARRRRSR